MNFHYMYLMYMTWLRIPGVTPSTFSVFADRYQPCKYWHLLLTEGNTAGVLGSDDSSTRHTLGYTE